MNSVCCIDVVLNIITKPSADKCSRTPGRVWSADRPQIARAIVQSSPHRNWTKFERGLSAMKCRVEQAHARWRHMRARPQVKVGDGIAHSPLCLNRLFSAVPRFVLSEILQILSWVWSAWTCSYSHCCALMVTPLLHWLPVLCNSKHLGIAYSSAIPLQLQTRHCLQFCKITPASDLLIHQKDHPRYLGQHR